MTDALNELCKIAADLAKARENFKESLKTAIRIEKAAQKAGKAFSGSWLGHQSRVYSRNFETPPPGLIFNAVDWGSLVMHFDDSGDFWQTYSKEQVDNFILETAGNPDKEALEQNTLEVTDQLSTGRLELVSILEIETGLHPQDAFLKKLKLECENLYWREPFDIIKAMKPPGPSVARDMRAVSEGFQVPPHVRFLGEVASMRDVEDGIEKAISIANTAHSHLRRLGSKEKAKTMTSRVFIGHGRSAVWKDLRDFLRDHLSLEFEEFNRVPVAGIPTIERLKAMLDGASFAFIVMTAEDETHDGNFQARMNVIHEAGLFQGRLGFDRAIILLEDGCEEFSNIEGLGQIRFPQGNIMAKSEDIRQVLKREKLI